MLLIVKLAAATYCYPPYLEFISKAAQWIMDSSFAENQATRTSNFLIAPPPRALFYDTVIFVEKIESGYSIVVLHEIKTGFLELSYAKCAFIVSSLLRYS